MDIAKTTFGEYFENVKGDDSSFNDEEARTIESLEQRLESGFASRKYVLGLLIDFCLLAQVVSRVDKSLLVFSRGGGSEYFEKNPPLTHFGKTELNTLTIKVGERSVGIRKFEELVRQFFESNGYYN